MPASQGSHCNHRGRARRRGRATPPLRTRTRCEASGARRQDSCRRRADGPPTHAGRPAAALDSGRSCAGTPGRQGHDGQQSHGKSNQGQEGRHTAQFEAGAGEPCACRLGSCRTRRPPPTWGSRRVGRRKRPRGRARAGAPTWLGVALGLGGKGKGSGLGSGLGVGVAVPRAGAPKGRPPPVRAERERSASAALLLARTPEGAHFVLVLALLAREALAA